MNDRKALLRKIAAAQFAAFELHIYLDTHPADSAAIRSYKKYNETAETLVAEYESKYGPLTPNDVYGDTTWQWINNPWPWENDKEA